MAYDCYGSRCRFVQQLLAHFRVLWCVWFMGCTVLTYCTRNQSHWGVVLNMCYLKCETSQSLVKTYCVHDKVCFTVESAGSWQLCMCVGDYIVTPRAEVFCIRRCQQQRQEPARSIECRELFGNLLEGVIRQRFIHKRQPGNTWSIC